MLEIRKYLPNEIEAFLEQYNKACYHYYRTAETIMTDWDFDNLKEVLEFNDVDFTYEDAEPIGSNNEKLVGDSGMGSLIKVQVFDDKGLTIEHMNKVAKWLQQSNPNLKKDSKILVGWKLDGNAIKIVWNQQTGEINDIITRGNISRKLKFIEQISKELIYHGEPETRCEAVMSKDIFNEKYSDEYANPRNLVSGILNDEDINDYRKSDVMFVPLNNGCSPTKLPHELQYDEIELQELPKLYFDYLKSRSEFPWANDGLVIYLDGVKELKMKGKYPLHSLAIKFPPVKVNATIKEIQWNLKKGGEFIPKILLNPVDLDGTSQKQVAAFNYGYVMENKLFPGAVIEIGKNGDIIAYVQRVIVPGSEENRPQLPNGSKVVDIHLMADGPEAQRIADSERFIAGCYTLGIKNFGYAWFKVLSDLCDNDITNLFDKEIVNVGSLNRIFGGQKKQVEFMDKLSKLKLNTYNLIMLLQFPNCGPATALQLANHFSGLETNFNGLQKDIVAEAITETGQIAVRVAMANFKLFENGYTVEKMKADNHVYDATFEMTGSPKPMFDTKNDFIRSVPNWKHSPLKQGTTYLVTDSPDSNTGKMAKARKLGIEILTYEQAYELYTKNN